MLNQTQYLKRYGVAIVSVLIALLLMLALDPVLQLTQAPFLLFFGAVTVSAFSGGQSPGIVATLLSAGFTCYYFLEPHHSWKLTLASGLKLALFILEGVLITLLVAALRKAQAEVRKKFNQLEAREAEIQDLNVALQRRVDELQALFNVIPINIALAEDPECHVVKVNAAYAKLLQIPTDMNVAVTPPAKQSQLPYKFYQNGREIPGDKLPVEYAAKHGVEVRDVEIELVRQDNTVFSLYGHAVPLFDESGQPRGSVGVYTNITERKQAEIEREQLLQREQAARVAAERANRVKDEFLAILSHELRSPLNPILGWTKLLQSRQLDAAKTAEALATIERNAKLLTRLIDDLLDTAKILRGKLTLEMATVDLVQVIEAALDTVRTAAVAKNIYLHLVMPQIGLVLGDATRLQQIVWNLLSNAIKFTPKNGRVNIQLARIGDRAQITVSDTGKGIQRDFLPHIFESFRQEDASTTRRFGGLGLGLAIVRQLIEAHGGTITADSPGVGLGATFTVQLPLVNVELEPQADKGSV